MSKQTINIGASPNDGTGTPLRTSFDYTNQNFTELYTALGGGVGLPGATTQVIFNDGGTNLAGDAGLVYNKTTDALTVGGNVQASSATITGALTVDTTTLVANAAGYTDKVGVGTATPAATLHIKGSGRVDSDYNLFDFYKDNGSTRLGYLLFRDDGANYLNVNSNQPLYLSTNNTAQVQVETSGDVKINTGNVVMATSGKGIDFSATANSSGTMTSELLNDYEEGTWDASFVSGGGTVTINTAVNRCRYTKIGRLVTVNGLIQVSSVSSPTGPLLISGLPFTIPAATEGDTYSAASLSADNLEVTATGQIVGYGSPSTTNIYLYRYQAGAIIGLAPSAKAASEFIFTFTYSV